MNVIDWATNGTDRSVNVNEVPMTVKGMCKASIDHPLAVTDRSKTMNHGFLRFLRGFEV
jgi:hypothetical protein